MQVPVFDTTAKEVGTETLNDTVFGIEPNLHLMYEAYERQLANARQGTHDTKTRSEVRGGGRKPWRQKGTGRARHGSIRSPIWRGGGVAFGPKPRSYQKKMNKKARQLAIRSVLSVKAREEELVLIKGMNDVEPRARTMRELLDKLPVGERSTLIVIGSEGQWESVFRAAGNLQNVKILRAGYINMRDVLTHNRLLMTTEALEDIHSLWAVEQG